MKKINTRIIAWIIVAVMFAAFIPAVITRITNEQNNKNVTVSLLYNDLRNKVSEAKLSEMLVKYRDAGIDTVSVMEDDINALVARGDVTSLKYHDLRHKYDEESVAIAQYLGENYAEISYDTYLFILKEERIIAQFDKIIPLKYSDYDYLRIADIEGMVIYAFLNGREAIKDITVGYDEEAIARLHSMGYKIALSYIPKNYSRLGHLNYIEHLVKTYDIEYFNIKVGSKGYDERKVVRKNYIGIADIINKYGMTLVVTEDASQLSNQYCFGYDEICRLVTTNSGSKKIVRSYETYDDSHADGTHYKYRTQQYFNSVIDRNIRFITVTQISPETVTYDEGAAYSLRAAKEFIKDIEKRGFTVNEENTPFDYKVHSRLNAACAAVIIIMLGYLALSFIFNEQFKKLFYVLFGISALAFGFSFVAPKFILGLYPTVYCVAVSCFAMTMVMVFVKKYARKMNAFLGILATVALLIAILCIGVLGMCTLLSGVNFYLNNEIFRGIKLTLVAPIGFTAIAYYFIFMYKKGNNSVKKIDVEKTLDKEIRVYWLVAAAFIAVVGGVFLLIGRYYLMRSGNVNTISALETAMRNAITAAFPARPRTKEFIIGYPCIVLFFFYVKYYNSRIIQWVCAIGASILAASVTNTFCHVFTDATVMYMRVVNGVILGAAFAIIAYVANFTLIRILKILDSRFNISEKISDIKYFKNLGFAKKTENE